MNQDSNNMKRLEVVKNHGNHAILTYSGLVLDLLDPKPEMICIEDIAVGLSREFRFANQTVAPYSVAQHCYMVSSLVPTQFALHGLLHDAAEAYIKDIPSPLKTCLKSYEEIENKLTDAIYEKFKVNRSVVRIKAADKQALEFEWEELFEKQNFDFPWSIETSQLRFLCRYREIIDRKLKEYGKDNSAA